MTSLHFVLVIALLIVLPLASAWAKKRGAPKDYFVYIGAFTGPATPPEPPRQSESKGIYGYRFHVATDELMPLGLMAETWSPSFLTVHPDSHFLYAVVNEQNGGVSAYASDPVTGTLTFLNKAASHGDNPCFLGVDREGKDVLVANYTSGSVAVLPIHDDGRLDEASAVIQHSGSSANAQRQTSPHAHMISTSPDDRFAVAADLGLDKLLVYRFDAGKGSLSPNDPAFFKTAAGAGPRHFAFHPSGKFAYVVTEMVPAVVALSYDAARGAFRELQTISLAPADPSEKNTGAEIEVHPNGKFVHASIRGADTIAVFAIDQTKGTLRLVEQTSTQGKGPRAFEIDPTGSYLFAANQISGNVVVFRIDSKTGRLTPTGREVQVSAVACVKFAPAQ